MSFSRYLLVKGHHPSLQLPITIDLALMRLRWGRIWQRLWVPSFLLSPRLEAWFRLSSKRPEHNLATPTRLFCSPLCKNSSNKGAVQLKPKMTTLDAQAQIKTSDQTQTNFLNWLLSMMNKNSAKPTRRTEETLTMMRQLSPAQRSTSRNRILSHWTTIKTIRKAILAPYSLQRQARAAFINQKLASLWAPCHVDRPVNIRQSAKTPQGFLKTTLLQTSVWTSKTLRWVPTRTTWTILTGAKKSDQGSIISRLDNLSRADKTSK